MEELQEEVTVFADLFRGRTEAYGHEEGMCVREPLTGEVWRSHLYGKHPIGIYPVLPDNTVWWSCIDIDQDLPLAARDVADVYAHFGMGSWIERSRSKGWHVWIFHDSAVPCRVARAAGRAAVLLADLPATTEVNPKQDVLPDGKLGNYVRLPYAHVDRDNGFHRKMVEGGEALSLADFLDLAPVTRVPERALARLAELAPRPSKRGPGVFAATAYSVSGQDVPVRKGVFNQEVAAVAEGTARVPKGQRDLTFFTLANFLHGIGVERVEAERIMRRVLDQQTDHGDDPFPWSSVLEKLERVYGR